MARNRKISREHKKIEMMLNPCNEYGIHDPTPFEAVIKIRKEQRGEKDGTSNNIN